jgi:2Fe-2S ferredoxin
MPDLPVVRVEPIGVDIEVQPGETIIEAAWRLGYQWPTVCYGQAECTACLVEIVSGEEHLSLVGPDEQDALDNRILLGGRRDRSRLRLACRAKPTGAVTVHKRGVRAPGQVATEED